MSCLYHVLNWFLQTVIIPIILDHQNQVFRLLQETVIFLILRLLIGPWPPSRRSCWLQQTTRPTNRVHYETTILRFYASPTGLGLQRTERDKFDSGPVDHESMLNETSFCSRPQAQFTGVSSRQRWSWDF